MDGRTPQARDRQVSSRFFELFFQKEAPHLYSEPVETVLLSEAGEGDVKVRLSSGEYLVLYHADIKRLKELVPRYLYGKTRLPLHFKLTETSPPKLRIVGGEWQRRVIHYVLTGEIVWRPPEEVGEEEFSRLLRTLRSLIHLSLERRGV